ncbi:hypothetical protein D3C73_1223290 [compost metagenome]
MPAGQVDSLDAGLDLLYCLAAGQGAHAVDEIFFWAEGRVGTFGDQLPQFFCTQAGQGVLRLQGATQANDISGGVGTGHAFPARVFGPVFLEGCNLLFACQCHGNKPRRIDLGVIVLMLTKRIRGVAAVLFGGVRRRTRRLEGGRSCSLGEGMRRQVGSWMPCCGATRLPELR